MKKYPTLLLLVSCVVSAWILFVTVSMARHEIPPHETHGPIKFATPTVYISDLEKPCATTGFCMQ
jgi:hypothetical protein